jgi:hypothetical protein
VLHNAEKLANLSLYSTTRKRKEANRARDAAMKEAALTRISKKRRNDTQSDSNAEMREGVGGNDEWGGIDEASGSIQSKSDSDTNGTEDSDATEDPSPMSGQAIRVPSHLPESLFLEAASSVKVSPKFLKSKSSPHGKVRRSKASKSSGNGSLTERVVG